MLELNKKIIESNTKTNQN